MKIVDYTSQEAIISFSDKELMILKKAILEIKQFIFVNEFKIRLEASQPEIDKFLKLTNQLIVQVTCQNVVKNKFSFKEIVIINNVLNEICNGKKIADFNAKIGASFEEVDHLSLLICELGKKMYSIQTRVSRYELKAKNC